MNLRADRCVKPPIVCVPPSASDQIIDRSTEVEGLLIATGYSGDGFLIGPAIGEIVRDLYHGKQPGYDIRSFALDRFACTDIAAGETNIV
jgi:sarcosine oxidase, subunit beta